MLDVIDEQNNVDSSFGSVDQFVKGGVSCWGTVESVGGQPEVALGFVDQFPCSLEEGVAFVDVLGKGE